MPGAVSKLYAAVLVILSQFALAALGLLLLVVITEITHPAAPTKNYLGMNR